MAAADAPNSVSYPQRGQLTAPPGWTKKLVPAKAKNVTLRKHDTVFIAPDGHEIPSQWHLRRYLKAHSGGPGFSDFDWSSGEESIRRSGRACAKEISYSEKITRGKRKSSEMDAEGVEEGKIKSPVRKRAKNEVESDLYEDKEENLIKNEMMHDVTEGATIGGDVVVQEETETATVVLKDELDVNTGKPAENAMEEQAASAENVMNVTDAAIHEKREAEKITEEVLMAKLHEKPILEEVIEEMIIATNGGTHEKPVVEEVIEQLENLADVTHEKPIVQAGVEQLANVVDTVENPNAEVLEQVVKVKEVVVEVNEQVEKVTITSVELHQEEVESQVDVAEIGLAGRTNGINSKKPVLDSDELQDVSDLDRVESKVRDQELEVIDAVIVEPQQLLDNVIETADAVLEESQMSLDQNHDVADIVMKEAKKLLDQIPHVTDVIMGELEKPIDQDLEITASVMVESKKVPDENRALTEDVTEASLEFQEYKEGEKSVEPFMQREEQERLCSSNNSPLKVEHIREKSPNEICSSPVPVRVSNQ